MRGVALQVIVCKEAIAEVNAADAELKQVLASCKYVNSSQKVTAGVLVQSSSDLRANVTTGCARIRAVTFPTYKCSTAVNA